ncbi:MAG TPA: copper resistance protein B [Alicycliphilus sp.]|nr:copper resistance protein B [Alicycliphilus sp.]
MGGMDQGSMPMQGGSPPADARDPNGYSDGFVRGSGKYSLAGVPPLRLDDQRSFANLKVNRLERAWARHGEDATTYDLQARIGRDFDHLVIKAEGDVAKGKLHDSRTELLWGHAIAAYWDTQLGVRLDHGAGKDRQWLAAGVQGLAPYWFELDATAYLGSGGRSALRLEGSYDLLLTQKLVLQPRTEWNFYGKSDPANAIGSGLANASAGLRLRYEVTRQIAPYVGVEWQHSFGRTRDFVRAAGDRASQTRWVAGVSFWF